MRILLRQTFIDQVGVCAFRNPHQEQNARYIELLEYAKSVKNLFFQESFIRKLGGK